MLKVDDVLFSYLLGARARELASGVRVRLRLARLQDAPAIEQLLRAAGMAHETLDLARLLRADPRYRITICASALVGSSEMILGVGSIELGAAQPELLVVERDHSGELEWLLRMALRARAAAIAHRRDAA